MLRSDLCDYNNAHIAVAGKINVTSPDNNVYDKNWLLKITPHFIHALQKLMVNLLILVMI